MMLRLALLAIFSRGILCSPERDARAQLNRDILSKAIPVGNTFPARDLANDNDDYWGKMGFQVADFSIKFQTCSNLHFFGDPSGYNNQNRFLADNNNNNNNNNNKDNQNQNYNYQNYNAQNAQKNDMIQRDSFVTFRLCPSDTCQDGSNSGCDVTYGEYMLPLSDYIYAFSSYYATAQENYCAWCKKCLYFLKYFTETDDAMKYSVDNTCMSHCKRYDNLCAAEDNANNANGNNNAANEAKNTDDDNYYGDSYKTYLTCTKAPYPNPDDGKYYYIGPTCQPNKNRVILSVFSDQYCTDDVSNAVGVADITGVAKFDVNALKGFSKTNCFKCQEMSLYNVPDVDEESDSDGVNGVCESLYRKSAKCNKYIPGASYYSYGGSSQFSEANAVCNFITFIEMGKGDKYEMANVDAFNWDPSNTVTKQIVKVVTSGYNTVEDWQIVMLVSLGAACAFMILTAYVIHSRIINTEKALHQTFLVQKTRAESEKEILEARTFTRDMEPSESEELPQGHLA